MRIIVNITFSIATAIDFLSISVLGSLTFSSSKILSINESVSFPDPSLFTLDSINASTSDLYDFSTNLTISYIVESVTTSSFF